MMLVGGPADAPLRVALVTTHLALKDVPAAITRDAVGETLGIVGAELRAKFGIAAPRIAVCGLNPHAGEGGHLGREEIDAIAPAIAAARAQGIDATGPLPADTVFVPEHARAFDAIVAMYHDQGLPVLKAASFGHGVNVTLGLPFIRTSVDHGTALDLAADAARAATRRPGQPVRRGRPRGRAGAARAARDRRPGANGTSRASASARTSWSIRTTSRGSSPRSRRSPATTWSRSGPGLAALTRAADRARGPPRRPIEIDRDLAARLAADFPARAARRCTSPMRSHSTSPRWASACASSATCRTTSARRSCSTSRSTTTRSSTCT